MKKQTDAERWLERQRSREELNENIRTTFLVVGTFCAAGTMFVLAVLLCVNLVALFAPTRL